MKDDITSQAKEDYEDDGNQGLIKKAQGRVHSGVGHSWSEESPEGTCPTISDLILGDVLYKGSFKQGVLALPYLR